MSNLSQVSVNRNYKLKFQQTHFFDATIWFISFFIDLINKKDIYLCLINSAWNQFEFYVSSVWYSISAVNWKFNAMN